MVTAAGSVGVGLLFAPAGQKEVRKRPETRLKAALRRVDKVSLEVSGKSLMSVGMKLESGDGRGWEKFVVPRSRIRGIKRV